MNRKICVITGSRADYGLLSSLMRKIDADQSLELQVIVTGMHLSSSFGNTYKEIENDGFFINKKVESLNSFDDPVSISKSIGKSMFGCAKAIEELKPDIVLILGDRFEMFGAATAALITNTPIAHIHGGEITLDAYDEAFRHSISKMAHLHFVATSEYRKRVIQLGENPKSVFEVGGIGIDAIKELKLLDRRQLEDKLGIVLLRKSLLVTFHPATLSQESPAHQIDELLSALSDFADTTLIFTMSNADTGGRIITKSIQKFVNQHRNCYAFESLGRHLYLSCLANMSGVIGNSSSGILEAPSFGIGSINVGNRQSGRLQASSVINTKINKHEIVDAVNRLFSVEFQSTLKSIRNPYGEGGAGKKIIDILRSVSLERISQKKFFDLDFDVSEVSKFGTKS